MQWRIKNRKTESVFFLGLSIPVHLLLLLLLALHRLPLPALPLNFTYSPLGSSFSQYMETKGDVSFTPKYVQLTFAQTFLKGRIYNKQKLSLWDSAMREAASFNCSFTFRILPTNGVPPSDGLAFFLLDPLCSDIPPKSDGYWLGLVNITTNNYAATINNHPSAGVVAVEFDIHQNDFDIDGNHIGIDVNSLSSVNFTHDMSLSLAQSDSVTAWVDYSSSSSLLEVYASNLSESSKPSSPLLSYSINFSDYLPEQVFIGFSATTGLYYADQRLLSWTFNSTTMRTSAPQEPAPHTVLPLSTNDTHHSNHVSQLIAGLPATLILICLVALALLLLQKRRRQRQRRRLPTLPISGLPLSGLPSTSDACLGQQKFNYRDLSEATNHFGDDCLLGRGGFGPVYKGCLPDGSEVAVKRIAETSAQGEKEFFAEVSIISRIRHRNLVHLKGWCRDKGDLLLVYEYLPNGSLDHHLFREEPSVFLEWSQRYKIVCGLGSALEYLHHLCEKVIVHRDIKASNVMLDENYNAKLGDFGLARQLREFAEGHTTFAAGTVGYIAPETSITRRATTKSDVYSYGVVLLEVVCGLRPITSSNSSLSQFDGILVDWVWDLHSKGRLREARDDKLGEAFDEEQLLRTLIVGLACVHPDPNSRPSIELALDALKGKVPLPCVPPLKPVVYYGAFPCKMNASTTSSSVDIATPNSSFSM